MPWRRRRRSGAPEGGLPIRWAAVDDLALAMDLADAADRISMDRWRAHDLRIDRKPDLSPVTEADQAIEHAFRERVQRDRPGHAFLGEEYGRIEGGDWRWVVDPIDGTRSFVRGNETWATLIALQHAGTTQVAIASAPALRLRFHAVRGQGSYMNGRQIHVSEISSVDEALLTHSSLNGFVHVGLGPRITKLADRCWDARGLGNSMSHLAVARGTADMGWTARANVWDFAALALIVEEAGGRFTDRSGDDPQLGGTGISSNGLLHEAALEAAGL